MKSDAGPALRAVGRVAVITLVLLVTGLTLRPWEEPAWRQVRAAQPALQLRNVQGALGDGVLVGLLGGFRALIADVLWIRLNASWEDHDLPASQTLIRLVTAIDPRPLYFWLNGARMIAYDMPVWRIEAAGGYGAVSVAEQRRFDLEQAAVALAYLQGAREHHPTSPLVVIEEANVQLNRRKDLPAAAAAYRAAASMPGAPPYATRLYAELLRKMGRPEEAYAWLRGVYPTIAPVTPKAASESPDADAAPARRRQQEETWLQQAAAEVVLERIRELERELKVPEAERFNP